MASFSPMMWFRREDLPALGRPIKETKPDFTLFARVTDFLFLVVFLTRRAGDAHFADAPAFGVDHLDVQSVDIESFADGRYVPEVAQQVSTDGFEPFAFYRHMQAFRNLVDVGGAAEDERPVALFNDGLGFDIVFIANFTKNFFDQILERDEASGTAILIDHNRALYALMLELAQQLAHQFRLGHEMRWPQMIRDWRVPLQ